MNDDIYTIYRDYEREKARRKKLVKIAYQLDNPKRANPMRKLILILIALSLIAIGCAKPLCSSYTHQGVYHYNTGVIKVYPQNKIMK